MTAEDQAKPSESQGGLPEDEVRRAAIIRGFSREHLERYLATDGAGFDEVLILTTTGRRSGQPRSTPLTFGRDGDRYILIGSNGGSPGHPHWYRNLAENPTVGVQFKAERFTARARTATGEERARLWRIMTAVLPAYDDYQARTQRDIPVVVLEPQT